MAIPWLLQHRVLAVATRGAGVLIDLDNWIGGHVSLGMRSLWSPILTFASSIVDRAFIRNRALPVYTLAAGPSFSLAIET